MKRTRKIFAVAVCLALLMASGGGATADISGVTYGSSPSFYEPLYVLSISNVTDQKEISLEEALGLLLEPGWGENAASDLEWRYTPRPGDDARDEVRRIIRLYEACAPVTLEITEMLREDYLDTFVFCSNESSAAAEVHIVSDPEFGDTAGTSFTLNNPGTYVFSSYNNGGEVYAYEMFIVKVTGDAPPVPTPAPVLHTESRGAAGATPAPTPAPDIITVTLDGEALVFDQPPIIDNGRTLVPLRVIFEALGADVEWEQATQTVTAVKEETTIVMQIGNPVMTINAVEITLDVPPQLLNGRTLVPVRAVAEGFGADVEWDADARTVIITTN